MADDIRLRVLGIGLLGAIVVGSAIRLEGVEPKAPRAATVVGRGTGAWFCPHGGRSDWQGWVVVTNPGTAPVDVRLTSLGQDGPPAVSTFTVAPERQVYRAVPADEVAAASEVEYFGGWVAAAIVLRAGGEVPALAAERCAAVPHPAWFLPDGTTGPEHVSHAVVMNPFEADAAVDVVIRTEERVVRHGTLTPYVVPARTSVAIRLDDFVLQGPNEQTVGVEVLTRVGRVVAGGVGVSPLGLRAELGIPTLRARWNVTASGAQGWSVPALNPGPDPSTLSFLAQTAMSQQTVEDLEEVSLPADAAATFALPELANTGTVVHSTNSVPFAAAARLTAGQDEATVNGAPQAGTRWLVLPALPPGGGSAFLMLQNPTLVDARVALTTLGPLRAGTLPDVLVPAGRTVAVEVPPSTEGVPLSVLVRAGGRGVVAAMASYSEGEAGYSATLGVPVEA